MPPLQDIKSTYLIFNLEKLDRVNSIGISKWINWLDGMGPVKLIYKKIPVQIVEILAHVKGFIPEGAQVRSFFVPYTSPNGELSKTVLFLRDKHFDSQGIYPPARVKHSDSGTELDMDILPTRYFAFLNLN